MDLFVIITFLAFTLGVAFISWYKTRGSNFSSKDGYFLAGRSLTGVTIAGTIMLTNLSTEQLIGLTGQSYMTNMGPMAWEATSCVALVLMAFVFLPKYLKSGIATIPDFLEERYDYSTKRIVSLLFILGYILTYLPTVLYSGSLVLNQLFGIGDRLGVSDFSAILIISGAIGVVGILYTTFGGLKITAYADTINGVGLLIGGLMIPILGLIALGDGSFMDGVNTLITVNPEKLNAINPANSQAPLVPWPVLCTGLLFNNLFYWCTNQAIVQKTFGAKNLAEAQKGVIFTGFLKLIGPFFLVIPGIIAFHLYGNTLSNADLAYPTLVLDVLPKPLLGLFAAVLFGAILSSFNGALNSTSTLFTLDIYKPIMQKKAQKMLATSGNDEVALDKTDEELVNMGRKFTTGLAILSIAIAPFILYAPAGLFGYLQECFGFYNVPILAAVVIGIFSKKVPAIAPKIALVSHIILYSLSKVFLGHIHFLYVLGVLFPINILIMLYVGKIKPRENDFVQADAGVVDLTPWKYAKPIAIFSIIAMAIMYLVFSPLGLAA